MSIDVEAHEHDWRVVTVCKDWCPGCRKFRRVCPPRHNHPRKRAAFLRARADRAYREIYPEARP